MTEPVLFLDAFADARRTWDDLISLQPDVKAGSGTLVPADLLELQRRIEAHRTAVDALLESLHPGLARERSHL